MFFFLMFRIIPLGGICILYFIFNGISMVKKQRPSGPSWSLFLFYRYVCIFLFSKKEILFWSKIMFLLVVVIMFILTSLPVLLAIIFYNKL